MTNRFVRTSSQAHWRLALLATACLVAFAAVTLAASYAWFVPLQTDGGWYSYPGFALAHGRDPSENLLSPDRLARESSGVRAAFGWENRSFLIVRFHQVWFALAGTTVFSLKVFGALQWLAVTVLVWLAVRLAVRSTAPALVAALAAMSDSWLISESMADARPDVPIALVACACVVAVTQGYRERRWPWVVVASILAAMLPLLHTTGILAFTCCAVLAGALAVVPSPDGSARRWPLVVVVVAGTLGFLFRQVIVDALVPTRLPVSAELPFRHDLWIKLRGIVAGGALAKLGTEVGRWCDYFLVSNGAHLVFVAAGLSGLLASVVRSDDAYQRRLSLGFLAAAAAAPAAMLFDPHPTPSHSVPLAVLTYIASGVGLLSIASRIPLRAVRCSLLIVGLGAAIIKGAHAAELSRASMAAGVSNRSVARFVSDVLNGQGDQLAVAPTFLWPYVPPTRSVVLIDPGSRPWEPTDPRFGSLSAVILDRDFLARGWRSLSRTMVQCGAFVEADSLGVREGFRLEAYEVNGPCTASPRTAPTSLTAPRPAAPSGPPFLEPLRSR
jgi:hypothetical protein